MAVSKAAWSSVCIVNVLVFCAARQAVVSQAKGQDRAVKALG